MSLFFHSQKFSLNQSFLFRFSFCLLVGLCSLKTLAASSKSVKDGSNPAISVRMDCLHLFNRDKGASQDCLTLTSLKIKLTDRDGDHIQSYVELDPMAGPDAIRNRLPGTLFYPERENYLINDFGVIWQARPALNIRLGSHDGLSIPPRAHQGSFEGTLVGSGWKQLALSVNYRLSLFDQFDVSMTVGNGEGELYKNLDPQQYFGFEAKAQIVKGFIAGIGLSLDGNSRGSEQAEWLDKRLQESCGSSFESGVERETVGFQTQRGAFYLGLDGNFPGMEGFSALGSMRRITFRDLKEKSNAYPEISSNCRIEDWSWAMVEDRLKQKSNSIVITVSSLAIGYRILDTLQLGLDFQTLSVASSEAEFLRTCGTVMNGTCQQPQESVKKASQSAYSIFLGIDLNDRLELATEYHARTFDRLYDRVYYLDRNEKGSKETDLFNVRILYRFGA